MHQKINDLFYAGDHAGAMRVIDFAIAKDPQDVNLYNAKARTYQAMGDHKSAEKWCTALMKKVPPSYELFVQRATVRNEISDYPGVIADLNAAESFMQGDFRLHLKRGGAYWEMRDWEKADKDFKRALALAPTEADAIWINGLLDLQLGRFDTGWTRYEARWDSARFKSSRLVTEKPRWTPTSGYRRVLVWGEQGMGDQIFYANMLDALRRRVDKVTMMVDPRLITLFKRSMPDIDFVPNTSEIDPGDHDSHLPIASLASQFVRTLSDISTYASHNYLITDPERKVKRPTDRLIAVSWTSAAVRIGPHKSMTLEEFSPILDVPNCKFVSVQYTSNLTEPNDTRIIKAPVDCRNDIEGLAALLKSCDCLVSVSNSTVHLAAALGVPVLLLDANKLWYWGNKDGDRSLWYPNVRIFQRDNVLAPWTNAVQRVVEALRNP